jgi:hypothetical protein
MGASGLALDFGKDAMMDSATARLRPMRMMWQFPFVTRASDSAIARPIPDVPPTKMATGMDEGEYDLFEARTWVIVGIEGSYEIVQSELSLHPI